MSIRRHKDEEHMLISIFAVEDFLGSNELNILYVFENRNSPLFEILIISRVRGDLIGPPSIARVFPSANLFEREIADSFGIAFPGAYDTRRLYLHESYPHNFYPLRKAVPNQFPGEGEQAEWYQFKEIQGEGVFVVPVGPVHAGIIEPGHFRFSVIGETIVNLEIRLGFLHRGVEKLAEGRIPSEGVSIVESISGDESVVNACGFCCAVEQICGVSVPPRALYIRGILLELERAYSLISDLAGMVTDIAHPASASQLLMLRETLQRQADILTGSRFMKGSICIGGVKQDISPSLMDDLFKAAGHIERELQRICNWILGISTVIDRFASTGQIRVDLINSLSLSGPIARACGSNADVRMDHPYGIYRERPSPLNFVIGGDVLARFTLKYQEVLGALRYIQELIVFLPEGPVTCPVPISDGYALATLESPRGMTMHWVLIQQGKIARYKVRTASLCNWYAIEHAVIGNIVPDFPLINKSLNLSYAGTDL
jgi:Ni,Fe-hydrogenase III large subunit/NADH:ubiquinone oxidoreductase subunit C